MPKYLSILPGSDRARCFFAVIACARGAEKAPGTSASSTSQNYPRHPTSTSAPAARPGTRPLKPTGNDLLGSRPSDRHAVEIFTLVPLSFVPCLCLATTLSPFPSFPRLSSHRTARSRARLGDTRFSRGQASRISNLQQHITGESHCGLMVG